MNDHPPPSDSAWRLSAYTRKPNVCACMHAWKPTFVGRGELFDIPHKLAVTAAEAISSVFIQSALLDLLVHIDLRAIHTEQFMRACVRACVQVSICRCVCDDQSYCRRRAYMENVHTLTYIWRDINITSHTFLNVDTHAHAVEFAIHGGMHIDSHTHIYSTEVSMHLYTYTCIYMHELRYTYSYP